MIDAVIDRFGLTRMPFGRDLPPGRLHSTPTAPRPAARITWAVAAKTIGLITGEVGTGRTAAVRATVAGLGWRGLKEQVSYRSLIKYGQADKDGEGSKGDSHE
jgi:type II secretory pathway predicted ATPase ExeA